MAFHLSARLKSMRAKTLGSHPDFFALKFAYGDPTIVETSKNICAALGNIIPKEPRMEELIDIYDLVVEWHQEKGGFEKLPKRLMRKCPWFVFKEVDERRPALMEIAKLNTALIRHIRLEEDPRTVLALAFIFLRTYPKQKPYFENIGRIIGQLVSNLSNQRGKRFARQVRDYHLFANNGPDKVVTAIKISRDSISETLAECGLYGGCQQEGFVEDMYDKWIRSMSTSLKTAEYRVVKSELEQLLKFSVSDNSLRFPNKRVILADGMLLPFLNKKPAPVCKEILRDFLQEYLGDPRFDKGDWVGVNENALSVMYGWLSEIVLEDFFRLLDYSAKYDSDADRQWKYRKAFWSACLKNGLIDNAWVALGRKVADSAEYFLDGKKNIYAEIYGTGVQGHHAVLIMQIGNMIVTEWSHSGKYRFWEDLNHDRPKLYKTSYVRNDVVALPDFEGIHYGAKKGTWQAEVADYIRSQTGIRLPYREYMKS